MFKIIKKADIVLLAVLLIVSTTLSYWSFSGGSGAKAVVTVDGELYGTYSLSQDQVIEIRQNNHLNKITIKDGSVQMSYSDCHNQICVNDGRISRANQSIVCLPNKVMVEIIGGEEDIDAVAN